jgi:hypothetical protein
MTEQSKSAISMDLIHSEDEVKHALSHLLGGADESRSSLQGHETMTLYRNVRKKYVSGEYLKEYDLKEGPKQVCTYRSVDRGLLAAYQAGCCPVAERPASAMYMQVNPRDVVAALKETHTRYYKWVEQKVGTTKDQVRKGNTADFAGTLDHVFQLQVSRHQTQRRFDVIDVDDSNPDTWLKRIVEAIGEEAIEMLIETKNGFHVVYKPSKMLKADHLQLKQVLESDIGKGKDEKVSKLDGNAVSCALPGGYQADHKARIQRCSCAHPPNIT